MLSPVLAHRRRSTSTSTWSRGNTSKNSGGVAQVVHTISHSLGFSSGSKRKLIVGHVCDANGVSASGITYNGNALTLRSRLTDSYTDLELWYLDAADLPADTDAHDLVVTLTSSTTCGFIATDYSGVEQGDGGTPIQVAGGTVSEIDVVFTSHPLNSLLFSVTSIAVYDANTFSLATDSGGTATLLDQEDVSIATAEVATGDEAAPITSTITHT